MHHSYRPLSEPVPEAHISALRWDVDCGGVACPNGWMLPTTALG